MSYLFIALAAAVAIQGYLLFTRKHVWFDLVDETKKAVREAKADLHQKERDARNWSGDPLTESERASVLDAFRALARPALLLRTDPAADARNAPARLGGAAWLANDEQWPLDAQGKRLEFIAQLDFQRLPALEGFPQLGLARFFVGTDDLWGADFDHPERSQIAVLWHEGPADLGRLEEPAPLADDDYSPFQSVAVRREGLALRAQADKDLPDPYSWQAQRLTDSLGSRPGVDEIEDEMLTLAEAREIAHKVGGHPSFTQSDFRDAGQSREFDVLLLGVTSNEAIMWGDVGEASFMIRADDLARQDFSRVAFYWDCH